MSGRQIVVTGANRGLGLEFVRQWLAAGERVFALARRPDAADALRELVEANTGSCFVAACDVADADSVAAAARAVEVEFDRVDLLVNNAGTYGKRSAALSTVDFDDLRQTYEIDALGPLRVTRALQPLIRRADGARVVSVTSRMGSIEDNSSGGSWGYRMAKAALNMASVNMAHDFAEHGITSFVIHPGWVRTDMGGGGAPLGIDESVAGMIATIDGADSSMHGAFVDFNGETIPW